MTKTAQAEQNHDEIITTVNDSGVLRNWAFESETGPVDMVNHPPHYERGPKITFKVPNLPLEDGTPLPDMEITRIVQHIEIFRQVKDPRLATAFKYWWRVTFGGKGDDAEDIKKAIFYLTDYLEHPGD